MRLMVPRRAGVRGDIQVLRALAVLMVVIYHLWPTAVPGGYAGVDVFFVISGYLITAHLAREVELTGRIDLARFWARRARRLLPASLLVVLVSALATWVFVPTTFWQDWFKQMGASIFYVLNWVLAGDSVDYLAAENNASPVQHYWSLSVEEQFYLIWPVLLAVALALFFRSLGRTRAMVLALASVTLASFVGSWTMTVAAPAPAYFVTFTRAWEFGIGGLLAFATLRQPRWIREIQAWLGIAGITWVAFAFDSSTPFPGYMALIPVISTALVIAAHADDRVDTPFGLLSRFSPLQYVGDVSYSLYLWHWPLIVLAPYVLSRKLESFDLVMILVASLLLAVATKRYVEDRYRSAPFLVDRRPRATLLLTAVAMVGVMLVPSSGFLFARVQSANALTMAESMAETPSQCFGAAALVEDACERDEPGDEVFPNLAALKDDTSMAYRCYNRSPENGQVSSCSYGEAGDGGLRVAVTGDSHGGMLVAGLVPHLDELDWEIDTYVSRGCTWADPTLDPACEDYREKLAREFVNGGYDIVITTAVRAAGASMREDEEFAAARAKAWAPVIEAGVEVVVVADNPRVPDEMVDCISTAADLVSARDACVMPLAQLEEPRDTGVIAAELEPRAHLIETADLYCDSSGCPMIVGDAAVYRDQHHLTATYATTVAPYLVTRIEEALASASG